MKLRFFLAIILGFSLASLALAPLGQDVPPRPVISLNVGNQTVTETISAYCWPVAVGNNQCDFAPQSNPTTPLQVPLGQAITVLIDPSPPNLSGLNVTVSDASGNTQGFNLDPQPQAIFAQPLPIGDNLLQVDALYSDVAGTEAYVSFVFLVSVYDPNAGQGGALTPDATAEPTVEVAIATEDPTIEVLATAEPTEEPTIEVVVTEEPVEVQTEEVVATEASTQEPTVEAVVTEEPTVEVVVTEAPTEEVVATEAPTEEIVATEAPTEEPTVEVVATEAPTEEVVATEAPTEEIVATEAPTEEPTITPTPEPLVLIPTQAEVVATEEVEAVSDSARPTSTTVPLVPAGTQVAQATTPAPTPTVVPIEQPTEAPTAQLVFAGRTYTASGVNFCSMNASNQRVCVDTPVTSGQNIVLLQGFAAQIQLVDSSRPAQVEVAFLNPNNLTVVQSESRPGDRLVLLNVNVPPGEYIMRVSVSWGSSTAQYFFRVRVN